MKTLLAFLTLAAVALAALPVASAHTIDPIFPKCVVASDQPDMGEKVCVNPSDPSCTVYEVRTTFLGTTKTCLYPSGGCGNNCAAASPSSVNCYEVYSRTNVGTYSVVRRNSCAPPEAYTCPYEGAPISQCQSLVGGLLRPASASAAVECMPVYSRTNVGTYSIVRRDSCAPPEVYVCPYEGAPIGQCQDLLQANAAATSQPQCLQYYSDWTIGPVHHHQTDSCNAQNYICEQTAGDAVNQGFDASKCDLGLAAASASAPIPPVHPLDRRCWRTGQGELQSVYCIDPSDPSCLVFYQQITGVGSQWWCYPSGEHGSDF